MKKYNVFEDQGSTFAGRLLQSQLGAPAECESWYTATLWRNEDATKYYPGSGGQTLHPAGMEGCNELDEAFGFMGTLEDAREIAAAYNPLGYHCEIRQPEIRGDEIWLVVRELHLLENGPARVKLPARFTAACA